MTEVMLTTLAWTGALIAVVLLLRRPVARHFGAKAAYALWFLPLLRLLMPPIVLPAWMRPAEAVSQPVLAAEPATTTLVSIEPAAVPTIQSVGAVPTTITSPIDFVTPLVILWLVGAAIFLVRRFALYFTMRRNLLEGARPVGNVGAIRMVECRAADGPVAFGVIDKVVALPWDFMANRDRTTRDLAIAHELAHHRGHDLLVNFLVQPLFAMHWFSPLGWMGWRAMRRDQEAACDARVMAARPQEQRAHYANIIAGFATAATTNPRLALAAPMACPVLGDKSIIHRLRSLSMPNHSKRRRIAGQALFVGAALALPMTATISYAAQDAVEAPVAPPMTVTSTAAPAAPIITMQVETEVVRDESEFEQEFQDIEEEREVVVERNSERAERELERAEREMARAQKALENGEARVVRIERNYHNRMSHRGGMTEEERAELQAEMQELREKMGSEEYRTEIRLAVAEAMDSVPDIRHECDGSDEVVREYTTAKGKSVIAICNKATIKIAMGAIKEARKEIKKDRNLSEEERGAALKALDEAIEEMSDRS